MDTCLQYGPCTLKLLTAAVIIIKLQSLRFQAAAVCPLDHLDAAPSD